jgi:hypothetical protein
LFTSLHARYTHTPCTRLLHLGLVILFYRGFHLCLAILSHALNVKHAHMNIDLFLSCSLTLYNSSPVLALKMSVAPPYGMQAMPMGYPPPGMQHGFGHHVMQPAFAPSFQQPIASPTYGYGQPASLPPSFAQPASLPPSVTRKDFAPSVSRMDVHMSPQLSYQPSMDQRPDTVQYSRSKAVMPSQTMMQMPQMPSPTTRYFSPEEVYAPLTSGNYKVEQPSTMSDKVMPRYSQEKRPMAYSNVSRASFFLSAPIWKKIAGLRPLQPTRQTNPCT